MKTVSQAWGRIRESRREMLPSKKFTAIRRQRVPEGSAARGWSTGLGNTVLPSISGCEMKGCVIRNSKKKKKGIK